MANQIHREQLDEEQSRKLRALRTGVRVELQVNSPVNTHRVRADFVGLDEPRCLIVRVTDPARWHNMRDAFYTDNEVIFRSLIEDEAGEIIAFESTIKLVLTKPSRLIFIDYPDQLESRNLRSDQRYRVHSSVTLSDGSKPFGEGSLRDLSRHGCQVTLGRDSGLGKEMMDKKVSLRLKGTAEKAVEIQGQVVNYKADDTLSYFGIRFDEKNENNQRAIQALLADTLITI
ncbi:hypothetical protein HMF8227_01591 [Saliniradius amylolyticus]|uniref:Flagellar brake protein YcgR n=1 Tax=Saliniradius amylolyticus TaxID=2183582 RepID=A0A2S2E336_9ALTE|nr:PilZ domain-containing protein [Saliniradius amylolyticus]AWL12065.1 hypothetical protein HMF8227_01591 [Saliniradius amylolyticus]